MLLVEKLSLALTAEIRKGASSPGGNPEIYLNHGQHFFNDNPLLVVL
jgi:hypothetical protein